MGVSVASQPTHSILRGKEGGTVCAQLQLQVRHTHSSFPVSHDDLARKQCDQHHDDDGGRSKRHPRLQREGNAVCKQHVSAWGEVKRDCAQTVDVACDAHLLNCPRHGQH